MCSVGADSSVSASVCGPVQRAEFGVDVEQPVLAGEQRRIVGIGDLGESTLLGQQLAQRRRRRGRSRAGSRRAARRPDRTACGSGRAVTASPDRSTRRASSTALVDRSAAAGSRTSGAPRSTCALGMIDTATTSPAIGAVTVVSIFIDSRTAIGSPAATCRPARPARSRPAPASRRGARRRPRGRSVWLAASSSTRNPSSRRSDDQPMPPTAASSSGARTSSSSSTVTSATSAPCRIGVAMRARRGRRRAGSVSPSVAELDARRRPRPVAAAARARPTRRTLRWASARSSS